MAQSLHSLLGALQMTPKLTNRHGFIYARTLIGLCVSLGVQPKQRLYLNANLTRIVDAGPV